jgi:uncharacterized protein (DUF302 family)
MPAERRCRECIDFMPEEQRTESACHRKVTVTSISETCAMTNRSILGSTRACIGIGFALGAAAMLSISEPARAAAPVPAAHAEGVLTQRSDFGFDETVQRLRADIAAKGIRFFDAIDQAELGAGANLPIRRSTLLLFGNPPLGVQFLQANPLAGLDWPVRMLVTEGQDGGVSVSWTDFGYLQRRYAITGKDAQLKMASEVAASIAASTAR